MISEAALAALVWGSVALVALLFGYEVLALFGGQ